MRTIEINTTQNVTIEYELCTLGERILAFILDLAIILSAMLLIAMFTAFTLSSQLAETVNMVVLSLIFFLYTPTCEILMNGQSFGKKALRVRVVNLTGRQPQITDFLTRWVFRMVDIWLSAGAIAAIFSSTTAKGQRIGGMLSNTTVIKEKPRMTSSLKDILKIHSLENYEPRYTEVKNFTEEEMLLAKRVIDRVKKHPNQAHKKALHLMAGKIAEQLGIRQVPKNKIAFLKSVIQDYIALTR